MRPSASAALVGSVVRVAAARDGVITRHQLDELGLSRYRLEVLVKSGILIRYGRAVYRLGSLQGSWSEQVGWVVTQVGGWASHATAARLWGFDLVDLESFHVSVPRAGRGRIAPDGVTLHFVRYSPVGQVCSKEGIRLTTPCRTALDLATEPLPDHTLSDFLGHLVSHRYTRPGRIEEFAAKQPGHSPGAPRLRRVVARLGGGRFDSILEARLVRLLTEAGLPAPATQLEIRHRGRLLGRADLAWEKHRVILEADGYLHHTTPEAFERDRTRRNAMELAGWRVYQVTAQRIAGDPDGLVAEMRAALETAMSAADRTSTTAGVSSGQQASGGVRPASSPRNSRSALLRVSQPVLLQMAV